MVINEEIKSYAGVTLVELVVAIIILSVTILVFVGSFGNISKAIIAAKAKTLATNLAQEKVQILRQLPYHKILVTPTPSYYTEVSPPFPYDTTYFLPERILEGGMYFTRYTYVYSVQEVDGELEPLPAGTPDQGMKCIEVAVVYDTPFGKKAVRVKTVETNPEVEAYRGVITGKVRDKTTLQPLSGALVVVAENIGCRDYTDSNGNYTIRVPFGNYTVMASLHGYFPENTSVSVGANPQTVNFDLQKMSTGTVYGHVWINDRIVISQVVGSTTSPQGFVQEYIELYNPTTFYWQMATGEYEGIVGLKYQSTADLQPSSVTLRYLTLSIPPRSYYLIANTTTITVAGVVKPADAVFSTANVNYPNIIKTREEDGPQYAGGGVGIYWISTGEWIDRVGWDWNEGVKTAPIYETDGIDQVLGLETDEQYVRKVSTSGIVSGWGNVYDSDNNNKDFVEYRKPMQIPPRNSYDTLAPLTGRPAVGSIVTCNDGLSGMTYVYSVGSPPIPVFFLINVATGTWSVMVSSNEKVAIINNVFVPPNTTVGIPNDTTDPVWYANGYYFTQLSSSTELGFITGRVTDVLSQPLNNIMIRTPTNNTYTNSQGYYFLPTSTGIFTVECNPNNLNPLYVSATKEKVVVETGKITSGVDFVLPQGGRVKGFVTMDGVNPLSGVVFIAQTAEGFVYGEGVSDNNGIFYISNLSSGTYYVKPVLSEKEKATPVISTVTVKTGLTVHAGTFTVVGAMGKITGKVTYAGKPISVGVLIIASTATITTPPVLSVNTLTSTAYYITSSYEDGTYTLEVIGSTTTRYNVYAYYTTYNPDGTPVVSRKEITGLLVPQGSTVSNQNFAW